MKHLFIIIILFFTYLSSAQDSLQTVDSNSNLEYYKVSKVRIFISDVSEIQQLRKKGIVNERVKYQDGYLDTHIDEYETKILKESGFNYEIIIQDVTRDYLERTKESRERIKKLRKTTNQPSGLGSFGFGSRRRILHL